MASGPTPTAKAQETLSQLVARILDQLSVSAWLPAATFVLSFVLTWSIRQAHSSFPAAGVDDVLREAIHDIGGMSFQSLILLIGVVVLVTTLTQAFAFGAIRLFEGYWRSGPVATPLANSRCRHHQKRREFLEHGRDNLESAAFAYARQSMLAEGVLRLTVDILEADRTGHQVEGATDEDRKEARTVDWRPYAKANDVRQVEALTIRLLGDYPEDDYRILPTRLGNVLRSYEDRVHDPSEGSLEGWVQRVFRQLPEVVQIQHDQHRNRLDLYSSMMVVGTIAGAASVPLLWDAGTGYVAVSAAIAASLALLSYRAMIASARGYGSALETIRDVVREDPTEKAGAQSEL